MARPRVYYVRPRDDSSSARQGQAKGWSWVDKIGSFLGRIDPILGICADRGYEVVKCEGCTHAQLNELLEDPDTYGVILAGWHGASAGIQLDAPGAHGETHTLEYKTEAFNKQWRISDQPNPNLRFVVFHACDVSAKTLSGYLDRLRPLAGDVEVLGWPEESLLSIEGLPQTIYSVCHELPNMTSPAASATSFGLDPSLASDDGLLTSPSGNEFGDIPPPGEDPGQCVMPPPGHDDGLLTSPSVNEFGDIPPPGEDPVSASCHPQATTTDYSPARQSTSSETSLHPGRTPVSASCHPQIRDSTSPTRHHRSLTEARRDHRLCSRAGLRDAAERRPCPGAPAAD